MIPLQDMNNDEADVLPSIVNQIGQAGLVSIVCVSSISESNAGCR